jgi:hypothetical protein
MVNSLSERMFILEHYCFALKSFDAVRVAFSNSYPDKKVRNKRKIRRLVTKFWDTDSICEKRSSSDKTVELLPCRFQEMHQL